MKNKVKDFFNYSSSERKGSIVLIILLMLVISAYWVVGSFTGSSSIEFTDLSDEINLLNQDNRNQTSEFKEAVYFDFNPNEIGIDSWVKLGFSEKQAKSIIKYREKGGYFYKKEDLKRLYVVDDSIYNLLEPYILIQENSKASSTDYLEKCYFIKLIEDTIPIYDGFSELENIVCNKRNGNYAYYTGGFNNVENAKSSQLDLAKIGFQNTEIVKEHCNFGFTINKEKSSNKYKEKQIGVGNTNSLKSGLSNYMVNINSADTTEFKSLKGIGSYYSSKIVKYRKELGGFTSVEQLKEVYGVLPEVIDQNIKRLVLDSVSIEKININTCETVDLKKHPYISWNIANSIVQIRKSREPYKIVEEIKKSDLVNDEIYRKIAPYLKTE